jgi:hypothetical protein
MSRRLAATHRFDCRRLFRGPCAVGADSVDLQVMLRPSEAVLCGQPRDPFLEAAVVQLDDSVAVAADEVMMVGVGAKAVAKLSAVVTHRVDDVVVAEKRECPVNRRKADGGVAAIAKAPPEHLCGHVVRLRGQLVQQLQPAPGRTNPFRSEQTAGLVLRIRTH